MWCEQLVDGIFLPTDIKSAVFQICPRQSFAISNKLASVRADVNSVRPPPLMHTTEQCSWQGVGTMTARQSLPMLQKQVPA